MDTRRNINRVLRLLPSRALRVRPAHFQGKTSDVEPVNPFPSVVASSHSESRWTTTTTTLIPHMARQHSHEPQWLCRLAELPHARDPQRGAGHCDDSSQRSILVSHRLLTHRTG